MGGARQLSEFAEIKQAYQVLGVLPNSSALRIKVEYRRLAKLWHPDKWPHDRPQQQHASERMREINEAFRIAKHAPLRYHVDSQSTAAPRARARESMVRRTTPIPDKVEYVVRFATGGAFGIFVGLVLLFSDVPIGLAVVVPLLTAAAATVLGDRFWHWVLKYWWLWSP
jgi:hypothetical protein